MTTINSTTNLHKAAAQYIEVPKYMCFVRLQNKKIYQIETRQSKAQINKVASITLRANCTD